MMGSEEWKEIKGWPGYHVSSEGRVRSFKKCPSGKMMKISPRTTGLPYLTIRLSLNGTTKTCYVHRLVLETFSWPKPFDKAETRHMDGNTLNNTSANLQWGTHIENELDKFRHGTVARGEKHGSSKLKKSDIRVIRNALENGETQASLARLFGISSGHISEIKSRKKWSHVV